MEPYRRPIRQNQNDEEQHIQPQQSLPYALTPRQQIQQQQQQSYMYNPHQNPNHNYHYGANQLQGYHPGYHHHHHHQEQGQQQHLYRQQRQPQSQPQFIYENRPPPPPPQPYHAPPQPQPYHAPQDDFGGKKKFVDSGKKVYQTKPGLGVFTCDRPTQQEIDAFVSLGHLNALHSGDLAKIMYWSVKLWKRHNIEIPQRHLLSISSRIRALNNSAWKAKDIAFLMYGLQFLRADQTAGTLEYVLVLADIIRESLKGPMAIEEMLSQGISMMIYSLKSMNSNYAEVRDLLSALTDVISRWHHPINAMEVGNVLYGLQGCYSEHDEVRALLKALGTKIEAGGNDLSAQVVGNSLYGMQNMSEHPEVLEVLAILTVKFRQMDPRIRLSSQEIGNMFYGLKNLSADEGVVRGLLKILQEKVVMASSNAGFVLDGQAICNSLYGLRKMSTDYEEVTSLVSVIAVQIANNREDFTAQGISNALYGLNNMRSERPEVQQVLWALLPKLHSCRQEFGTQHVTNCVFGLRRMTSNAPAVLEILAALVRRIRSCKREFVSQNCSNCLYGLQGFSSDKIEVREVLTALVPHVRATNEAFLAQHVGNSLYGFQGLSSEHTEVLELLAAVTTRIRSCMHVISAQQAGNAMLGFQGMSSSKAEVRNCIAAFTIHLASCEEIFKSQEVGSSLYALQGLTHECPEVHQLLDALAPKILASEGLKCVAIGNSLYGLLGVMWAEEFFSSMTLFLFHCLNDIIYHSDGSGRLHQLTCEDVVRLRLGLGLALPEAQASNGHLSPSYEDWERINVLLAHELDRRRRDQDLYFSRKGLAHVHETKLQQAILAVHTMDEEVLTRLGLDSTGTSGEPEVTTDTYLFNFIECDIVLRLPGARTKNWVTINIELDDIHHRNGKRARFCQLRDKYLRSRGVAVERINSSSLWEQSQSDIEQWIIYIVEQEMQRRNLVTPLDSFT